MAMAANTSTTYTVIFDSVDSPSDDSGLDEEVEEGGATVEPGDPLLVVEFKTGKLELEDRS